MNTRFILVFIGLLGASVAALLWRTGGEVVVSHADSPVHSVEDLQDNTGFKAENAHISTFGTVEISKLEKGQPVYRITADACRNEALTDGDPVLYRVLLDRPTLRFYEQPKDLPTFEKVRIEGESAWIDSRSNDLLAMRESIEGPVRLQGAQVSIDEDGDGRFETRFTAREVACVLREQLDEDGRLPLEAIEAQGTAEERVAFLYDREFRASAESLRWKPSFAAEDAFFSEFQFGPQFLVLLNSKPPRKPERGRRRMEIRAPSGAILELGERIEGTSGEVPHRAARLQVEESIRIEERRLWEEGRPPELVFVATGRGARFALRLPDPGNREEAPAPQAEEPRPELQRIEIDEDVKAIGEFGTARATQAVIHYAGSAATGFDRAELAGPIAWVPGDSDALLEKLGLLTEENRGRELVLRCRGRATIQNESPITDDDAEPADEDERYRFTLRDQVRLGIEDGDSILEADRSLNALLVSQLVAAEPGGTPGKKELVPQDLTALDSVVVRLEGREVRGEKLVLEPLPASAGADARRLRLSGNPTIGFADPQSGQPMKLSCAGEAVIEISGSALRKAILERDVAVLPDAGAESGGFSLKCQELEILADETGEEYTLIARRAVEFSEVEQGLRVTCSILVRGADQRILLWGSPADIRVDKDGEEIRITADLLLLDERDETKTILALGLLRRIHVSPPPELLGSLASSGEEVSLDAQLVIARLGEGRTEVAALGRVEIRGELSARAALLQTIVLEGDEGNRSIELESLGFTPVRFRKPHEGAVIEGRAERVSFQGEDDATLYGRPHLTWQGTRDRAPIDPLPGLITTPEENEQIVLHLEASRTIRTSAAGIELHGDASVRQIGKSATRLAAKAIILERDEALRPALLRLVGDAELSGGTEIEIEGRKVPAIEITGDKIEIDLTAGDEVFKVWGMPASFRFKEKSYTDILFLEYSQRTQLPVDVKKY